MTQVTGNIEAISRKYDKFSVLIDGNWYGTKDEYAAEWDAYPAVGDLIDFDNGGKKYLSRMKIVGKGGATGPSGGEGHSAKAGYSNLGVELGHAANLGMQIAMGSTKASDVGKPAFYKEWSDSTDKIYAIMKAKRASYEAGEMEPEEKVEVKKGPVVPSLGEDDEDF